LTAGPLMGRLSDREHVRGDGDPSGVSLLVPQADGTARPVPLSPRGCLAVTCVALNPAEDRWLAAAAEPAIAAWVAADAGRRPRDEAGREAAARLIDGLVWREEAAARSPEVVALRDAIGAFRAAGVAQDAHAKAVAAARLEAIREVAYGAGHEINNPLANIAARAQSLLLDEQDPDRRRRLATIVDQAFRARDMIGGLMLFARPPRPQPAPVDAAEMVGAVVEACRAPAAARRLRFEYSPPPARVELVVDRAQVEEALRVITVNAFEAVEDGGRVAIEVHDRGAAAGRPVEIAVTDDGRGMDADTVRRAFDPFFSGRDAGRGIGLGLPKAWRLIEVNGGRIAVESVAGRGTRVTVSVGGALQTA